MSCFGFTNNSLIHSIFFEFGTAIFAETIKYISRVCSINDDLSVATIFGTRFHYSVRSSASRPISTLYPPYHRISNNYTVVGSTCVENDIVSRDVPLSLDSFILVDNVGSYSVSFAPDFINSRPSIVYLKNSEIVDICSFPSFGSHFLSSTSCT